jgi:hypothetical protein
MSWASRSLLATALLGCRASGSSPIAEARAGDRPADGPGVAVVELFTSEGCSSCPPAEAALERVADGARAAGRQVVPLAFHVDYWDELGWPDRFASPSFTARQRDYAGAFGDGSLYTPEMVVGGIDHFVGSNASRAAGAIADALARPAKFHVAVAVTRLSPDAVTVHYDVANGAADRAILWIAVAQRSTTVRVTRGENAGRTLRHTDVVRALARSAVREGGSDVVLRLPWVPAAGEADAVVLLQRASGPDSMAMLGAGAAEVPP